MRMRQIVFPTLAACLLSSAAHAQFTLAIDKPTIGPGDEFQISIAGGTPGHFVALLISATNGPTPYPKVGQIDIGFPQVIFLPGFVGPSGTIPLPCDVPCIELTPLAFTTYYQAMQFDLSLPSAPASGLSNPISITYDPITFRDCNTNGIHDACDIRDGTSLDSDQNGIPDECVDCDNDGEADGPNVSGRVWHDLACDGVEDVDDPGVADVVVTAYDNLDNVVGGTTTDASGDYTLLGVASDTGVRLEFTDYPSWLVVAPSAKGTGKEVQFVFGQTCDADLALIAPPELCPEGDNACLATPCYINGDPLAGGTAGPLDVLVRFPYGASGSGQNSYLAAAQDVGSTWGLTYQRSTDTLFAAAFLKRHCGFGPGGAGAIYAVAQACKGTPGPANVALWLDVNTLPGVNVGTVTRPDLPANHTGASIDADAYEKVGKVGLGGLAISEDERTLFAVNLAAREVIEIDIATKALLARRDAIAGIQCSNGQARPFAVSYFRGDLYVGVVCTGENGGTKADLNAHVRRLDGGTFVDVLSFPLDYKRGTTYAACVNIGGWFPWPPAGFFPPNCGQGSVVFPHPILSSIEFDNNGTMAVGFIDRFGHEVGVANLNLQGTAVVEGFSAGELLRAHEEGGAWVLESNGSSGVFTSGGAGNLQGPGGGEFFFEDFWEVNSLVAHHETSLGGVAIRPGSGEVVTTAFDPINGHPDEIRTGGVRHYDVTNGSDLASYKVFSLNQPGTFGKAAGVGDLALLCSAVPIEVGDRVFLDGNGDGVQQPGEDGIPAVTVELWRGGGLVTSTVTGPDGTFSFLGIVANDPTYQLRIPLGQPALSSTTPSPLHAGGDALVDSDGDPALAPGYVTAPLASLGPGRTDFSTDFGFVGL